jgi:carboxyl-terminal processing protease
MTRLVRELTQVVIVNIFRNSPAEEAGLHIHDSLLAVDGHPLVDESGFRRDLIVGKEGTSIELTVQTPGEEPRTIHITRRKITGELPVPYEVLTSPDGKRIGYILLTTFADSTVGPQVQAALEQMGKEKPLDGLILDNRMNSGGMSDVVTAVLSPFVQGTVGFFVERQEKDAFEIPPMDIYGSQKLPLVVLVGEGTASFGEISSGLLQDLGRAYLIGEITNGNVEILRGFNFSDGSLAWIAYRTFRPLNNPELDWEKTGVIPDEIVPSAWEEFTLQTDPAVLQALLHFDEQ